MSMILALAIAAATAAASPIPVETQVEGPGPQGMLKGTMVSPGGSAPIVLIIPGSGPTDRDGNNPLGVKASSYRLIAEGLAERGIGSVRIDKRGMFGSVGAVADANKVSISDYADDVKSWTSAIRKKTGVSCVWLLGHSEGGLVALAATRGVPDLCGVLLVATAGRPIGQVMAEQLKANPANAPVLEQALPAIASLEAGRKVDVSGLHPALQGLFAPQVQDYLINLFSFDPAKLLHGYSGPVLILQGQRDMQIGEVDARRLKEARPDAKLVLLADANHVLKSVPADDPAANMAAYADPALPLAPGVVAAIADFVMSRASAR